MKSFLIAVTVVICFTSCNKSPKTIPAKKDKSLIALVDPLNYSSQTQSFIGAAVPFGMLSLGPNTSLEGQELRYRNEDTYIYGFTHTDRTIAAHKNFSDLLIMPTTEVVYNNGSNGRKGYRSKFSHDQEKIEPGYYQVHLKDSDIHVELTASQRSGMHKYQFPSAKNQIIVLDLLYGSDLKDSRIKQVSRTEISGFRSSKLTPQGIFYDIQFSHPLSVDLIASKQKLTNKKAVFQIDNPKNEPVYIKIGISTVDETGAKKNLESEIGDLTFDQLKEKAQEIWENQLERIVIESNQEVYKKHFYTTLYHTLLSPQISQDVDGRYRGLDYKIHKTEDYQHFTNLGNSLRQSTYPLFNIIQRKRTSDFINSFLYNYKSGRSFTSKNFQKELEQSSPLISSVIADAYLKGIKGFDPKWAFEVLKLAAVKNRPEITTYNDLGYIPLEDDFDAVSRTLSYGYEDWAISVLAKGLDQDEDYKNYIKSAQNYKNLFDPETRFLKGRLHNFWAEPQHSRLTGSNHLKQEIAFNALQDISGLIALKGGKELMERQLDSLFKNIDSISKDQITVNGAKSHPNQNQMAQRKKLAYLYNYINSPYKTQEIVRRILSDEFLKPSTERNSDFESTYNPTWNLFSTLGFYPLIPGTNYYLIGSPSVEKATLNLENGRTFTIKAHNFSEDNIYIDFVKLNGKRLHESYIYSRDILAGGVIEFYMTNLPSDWATKDEDAPSQKINDFKIVSVPFIAKGDLSFLNDTEIELKNADPEADIYYTLNDSTFTKYEHAFKIDKSSELKFYSQKEDLKSATVSTTFSKLNTAISVTLQSKTDSKFENAIPKILIDGLRGGKDYRSKAWLGFKNKAFIATLKISGDSIPSQININFLQDQSAQIFLPESVYCYVSEDNRNFKLLEKQTFDANKQSNQKKILNVSFETAGRDIKFVKLIANPHSASKSNSSTKKTPTETWIYVDEITLK